MKKWNLWIASFLVVVIVYQICYGLETLLPGNVSWLMTVKHDWGTQYLGWLFYKNEVWHFPLGDVQNYFAPIGTNVGFTDSIPLFAIFFKLFSPILSGDFQFFGIWLFSCHLLTAIYTIKICRLFKLNFLYSIIAVIFITANPVLIYRGLHLGLCAHWLLIAFIYLYCLDPSVVSPRKILRHQFVLLMISSLLNPYLCLMVLGFSLTLAVKLYFYDKAVNRKQFLFNLGLTSISLVISGWLMGIIRFGGGEDVGVSGGYGLYGLNLHSLYNSFGFSSFLPGIKQVNPHQYEGYMYLGMGIFLLLTTLLIYGVYAVYKKSKLKSKKLKREGLEVKRPSILKSSWLPAWILIVLLTLFSISHVVTIDDHVLFKIPVPKFIIQIGDIFRASARFFWPVYYVILILTILTIARARIKPLLKTTILSVAILLQLYDTKLLFTFRKLSYGTYQLPIDEKNWTKLIGQFDEIVMVPPFETTNLENMDYQYFCWIAGKMGKPISTGYVPRTNNNAVQTYKDSLEARIEEARLSPRTIYITTPQHLKSFSFSLQTGAARINYLDGYYYIYDSRKNDPVVTELSKRLNEPFKAKIDSALSSIGGRKEFKKINDSSILVPGNLKYNLEQFKDKGNWVSVYGWAFREGTYENFRDSVFFILKNEKEQYLVAADVYLRPDVSDHFNTKLDSSGFTGHFFSSDVAKGVYTLGIAVKVENERYIYSLTDKIIRIGVSEFATVGKLNALPLTDDILFNFEELNTEPRHFYIQGWAFIKGQKPGDNIISIVLQKDNENYITETETMQRPDVTAHFKNGYNLDNSGFVVKVLKNALPKGKYKLGIYIKDSITKKEGAVFTGKEIEF